MKRSRRGGQPRSEFLDKLAATGNVNAAAEAAGYDLKHVYELRAEDNDFAAAWDEAETIACRALEAEVFRRSIECDDVQGDTVIVEDKGGERKIRKSSDALLLAQLRPHRPEDGGAQSSGLAIVALKDDLVAALHKAD